MATGRTLWQKDVDDFASNDAWTTLHSVPLAWVVTWDPEGGLYTFVDASGPIVTGRSVRIPGP